ncbi:MAG: hypothetical protein F6K14_17260 [Symploca sp. SIO2C1]|nr:hypothetical protein [Symploca sp. SIO2C1]
MGSRSRIRTDGWLYLRFTNTGDASFAESAANALTDIIKDRVEQEIRDSASAAASRAHSCSRWHQHPWLTVLEGKN